MKCQTQEVALTSTLYPSGMAFYHRPSASIEVLTQDREDPTIYYLTVLLNRATPEQNCTTTRIRGSRKDGLLKHELEDYLCFYESQILEHWDVTYVVGRADSLLPTDQKTLTA